MTIIAKVLVPAALALAAFGAQAAGNGQIPNYGSEAQPVVAAAVAGAAAAVTSFRGEEASGLKIEATTQRSRSEVQGEIKATTKVNRDYVA